MSTTTYAVPAADFAYRLTRAGVIMSTEATRTRRRAC
jgi:hypothetical protein